MEEYRAGFERERVAKALGEGDYHDMMLPARQFSAELRDFWNPPQTPTDIIDVAKNLNTASGKFPESFNGDYYYILRTNGKMLLSSESPILAETGVGVYAAGKLKMENGLITGVEFPGALGPNRINQFAQSTYDALTGYGYAYDTGPRLVEINPKNGLYRVFESALGYPSQRAFETQMALRAGIPDIPLGLSEQEFLNFKSRIRAELDSMPINYNPKDVRFVGSSVRGESSAYSETHGRPFSRDLEHDYDISVVLDTKRYNELATAIRDRLYPDSKELTTFEKEAVKGRIGIYWLNKISPDKQFSTRMYEFSRNIGVRKVQVSVIKKGSSFDDSVNLPFEIILIFINYGSE